MSTWLIILLAVVYIPAVIITDLPILLDKVKYDMDYVMMFIGLLPVFNILTAGLSIATCQEDWKAIFNKLGIKRKKDEV
jgi:hypothetical protein